MPANISPAAEAVLRLLANRHNVLVSGPPGTGKSRLLGEVARAFLGAPTGTSAPVLTPTAKVPIPAAPPAPPPGHYPSPTRSERKVFTTVFHQNTKHRDFVTGIVPGIGAAGAALSFRVQLGKLYEAAEHAAKPNGASLLIIDEINRGPAVQIFGGAIVAMESDKRLGPDGKPTATTQTFDLMRPDGSLASYALPHHLFLLAAMNQADTSVEPLDVAFLRRWTPHILAPEASVLRSHFGLSDPLPDSPEVPANAAQVYGALVRAWSAVNQRISVGRGPEYRIGHGVLMGGVPPGAPDAALEFVRPGWEILRAHVEEVFFGDLRGVAAVLNVGGAGHPLRLRTHSFAEQPRLELVGSTSPTGLELYKLLRAISA